MSPHKSFATGAWTTHLLPLPRLFLLFPSLLSMSVVAYLLYCKKKTLNVKSAFRKLFFAAGKLDLVWQTNRIDSNPTKQQIKFASTSLFFHIKEKKQGK